MRLHHQDSKLDVLKGLPLFVHCSKPELQEVAHVTDELELAEGEVLTRQGSTGREFMVLLEGTASVTRDGKHVTDIGPGDFIGEIALIADVPRSATVTATSPVRVFVVAAHDFHAVFEKAPTIASKLLQVLGERLHADAL